MSSQNASGTERVLHEGGACRGALKKPNTRHREATTRTDPTQIESCQLSDHRQDLPRYRIVGVLQLLAGSGAWGLASGRGVDCEDRRDILE